MIRWIRNEPAIVVALLIAVANMVGWSVTGSGEEALTNVIESLAVLLGGGVVRQSVTPVAKLRDR